MTAPRTARHWAQIGECTSVWGIRFLLGIYRLFGRMPFTVVLGPVLLFYWLSNAGLRRASLTWLTRVNDARPFCRGTPGTREGLTHLMRFAETILDKFLASAGQLGPESLTVENGGIFHADAPDQGAVILTSHTGCQELLSAASAFSTTHPIVVLQHTAHAEKFNALLEKAAGASAKLTFFEVSAITPATAMALSELSEKGAYIVIAGDRVPIGSEKATALVPFFGHPAAFPTGGALLALLFHCPLRMMTATRDGRKGRAPHYRVRFHSIDEHPSAPRGKRDAWLENAVWLYAAELQSELSRSPYDWFNFFDFWKDEHHAQKTV